MWHLVIALCVLFTSFVAQANQPEVTPKGAQAGTLSPDECDRLVRRSLFNMTFPPGSPAKANLVATCVAGQGHYTRSYFNCVFAAKYSDAMECAYAERGIDRSKTAPELAALKVGDAGSFGSSVSSTDTAVHKGSDPQTTIDQITRDRYLSERDNILKSLGESPPSDGHLPSHAWNAKIVKNGLLYGIVHEDFHDVQLVKISRDVANRTDSVVCVRYGSAEKLVISNGYCAALIGKYLHTELAE